MSAVPYVAASALLPLGAPSPSPRSDDLLAVASVIEGRDEDRWLGGIWSEGFAPGPAFTQDPCSTGTDRAKLDAGEIAMQTDSRFVVYLPASCQAQFIGPALDRFTARLKQVFAVYEAAAVERVLVSGDGHDTLGPYLGNSNMQVLAPTAVDPASALRLLETAIARHGSGIIHAAPSTVVSWDALNLTVIRSGLTYSKRGTPIAVGVGYIDALPDAAVPLNSDEQWAFASGPIEIHRSAEIEVPASTYPEVFDRSNNEVYLLAERSYALNWIARQDPADVDHVQAGVLVSEALGICGIDGGTPSPCVIDGGTP